MARTTIQRVIIIKKMDNVFILGYVYFTLPNEFFDESMIYGISCYKQVNANEILIKSKDITRSTVQKSICILATLPLYAYLKCKLYDALDCYFDLKNLTQSEFLENLYNYLNICIPLEIESDPELMYRELSATLLYESFSPKLVLTIFKLLLLENKVLFYGTEPGHLAQIILTFLSLLPKYMEYDVRKYQSALATSSKYQSAPQTEFPPTNLMVNGSDPSSATAAAYSSIFYDGILENSPKISPPHSDTTFRSYYPLEQQQREPEPFDIFVGEPLIGSLRPKSVQSCLGRSPKLQNGTAARAGNSSFYVSRSSLDRAFEASEIDDQKNWSRQNFHDADGLPLCHYDVGDCTEMAAPCGINGHYESMSFCCPYLSLPYLDLVAEKTNCGSSISSCIVGASNVLFKQKASTLFDVIVDVDTHRITFLNDTFPNRPHSERNYRRILSLTSADNRFVHYVVRRIKLLKPSPTPATTPLVRPTFAPSESSGHVTRDEDLADVQLSADRPPSPPVGMGRGGEGPPLLLGSCDQSPNAEEKKSEALSPTTTILQDTTKSHCPLVTTDNDSPTVNDVLVDSENLSIIIPPPNNSDQPLIINGEKEIIEKSKILHTSVSNVSLAGSVDRNKNIEICDNIDLDAWIRGQFRLYLVSLLSTTKMSDNIYRPRYEEDFNPFFVDAFKSTRAYGIWDACSHPGISEVLAGHPFQGALGIVDVRLRLSNALTNNERGKKLLDEAATTAGKGLGIAWSSAKSAISSIFK